MLIRSLECLTPPTLIPITIQELKAQCRITLDDEDVLLLNYIQAATDHIQIETRRQLLTATYRMGLDRFPCLSDPWGASMIPLLNPPLQSVTSVKYFDTNGIEQTWDAANYGVDTLHEPGRVYLLPSTTWPSTYDIPNAVTITYVAGWRSAALVPAGLRMATRLVAAHFYENREETVEKALSCLPTGAKTLMLNHSLVEFV